MEFRIEMMQRMGAVQKRLQRKKLRESLERQCHDSYQNRASVVEEVFNRMHGKAAPWARIVTANSEKQNVNGPLLSCSK